MGQKTKVPKWCEVLDGGIVAPKWLDYSHYDDGGLTQGDISWCVQLEIDLVDEGQDTAVLTPAQYRQGKKFLEMFPDYGEFR